MTDKLYRIRKLVWDGDKHGARTPQGYEVYIYNHCAMWRHSVGVGWSSWVRCGDSLDAAKLAAETHWVSRVEGCLEEVK